ncbi:NMD protein affecting ribosome stability and mRNA decay [Phaffia rhodozyma]|uniref:60S ribosomal export protein NMD3 n=1 Tax=Phaffia rhodozyma TaxID=264483 RepID=A0A0F7SHJ0_PHARH|nr:NMD protein affecting ribosome stability and mRNA decay [Phaffia rhodozyma]
MEYTPQTVAHYVLCADCGTPIEPNSANLCISCLRNTVDITEGIPKQSSINFCRNCSRYLAPPQSWVSCELESRELLSICLRKLKGLVKVRLIDAAFVWTEPHSKRIRVKLTIQKEVFTSTILQQIFEVEYVVSHGQCPDCTRLAAKNMWKASVQVRQKVNHKRTFLYLEQLILKHNAHKDTISIKEAKDGLDFMYIQRSHSIKMCEFLAAVAPVRVKSSEQLLSTDTHSGTSSYKFTYSVEIAPICKDDLICLNTKLARSLSNISPLSIVTRISNSIQILDPATLQQTDIPSNVYWREPFSSLTQVTDLIEFLVLDVEPSGPVRGKYVLADAQVTFANTTTTHTSTAEGGGDGIYHTRTHLGGILQPGDTVLGYFLARANFNDEAFEQLDPSRIPDVILVKKTYPNRRKKNRTRNWRLKSIAIEAEEVPSTGADKVHGRGAIGRRGGLDQQRVEKDYELFLRELEEDPELRGTINLFKAAPAASAAAVPAETDGQSVDVAMGGSSSAGSGLAGGKRRGGKKTAFSMDTDQVATPAAPTMIAGEENEDEEDEEDFPDVDLDELLDHFEELAMSDDGADPEVAAHIEEEIEAFAKEE